MKSAQLDRDMAMTVTGPISSDELGVTLTHEHVLFDTSAWLVDPPTTLAEKIRDMPVEMRNLGHIRRDPVVNRDNLHFVDTAIAEEELLLYKEAGGGTIVDVTPIKSTFSRRPKALHELSKKTGVNVVMGTGYYMASTHPPELLKMRIDDIAKVIIDEFHNGIDDTGIRPGIIGELGNSGSVHPEEERVLKAAALAQQETGLALSIHPPVPYGRAGLRILDILVNAGADPVRIIMGHMYHSISDLDYHRAVADAGATLAYDRFGAEFCWESWPGGEYRNPGSRGGYREEHDWNVCDAIATLVREGYADRIVISHDTAYKIQLRHYGGGGFSHILEHVLPRLRLLQISESDIRRMTVDNPRALLTLSREMPIRQ